MIGILLGLGLFILGLLIDLNIPKKIINEYPTEIIEKIPWSSDIDSPSSLARYFGVVKYKIEEKELDYIESIPSKEANFDKKINFKRPISLRHKNIYIFVWCIKRVGIIILFVSMILKIKNDGVSL